MEITMAAVRTFTMRFAAVAALALMAAGLFGGSALAVPNTGHLSISARTNIQTGDCEGMGGTATVSTKKGSVTNGHQVISTTVSCSGGTLDGETCVNTANDTTCTTSMTVQPTSVAPNAAVVAGRVGAAQGSADASPTPAAIASVSLSGPAIVAVKP